MAIHGHSRTTKTRRDLRYRTSVPLYPMPSELVMRVRFPSSALLAQPQVRGVIRRFSLYLYDARSVVKVVNALQADSGQGRETRDSATRSRLVSGRVH
jgi:hypothetical protein